MARILVSQHYSRNMGNVSLLYTLVEALKEELPEAKITVGSFEPDETRKLFDYDCCEWPFVTRHLVDRKGAKRVLAGLVELSLIVMQIMAAVAVRLRFAKVEQLRGRLRPLGIICESDVVISPGGHLFTSFNPFIGVCAHFFPCFLAWIVETPYVVIGQTLGPFFGLWRHPDAMITSFLLRKASYVSTREYSSFENLGEYGIPTEKIKKTSELVFLYPEEPKDGEKAVANDQAEVLGITFHHIYYKYWMTTEDYVQRMSDFLRRVTDRFDFSVKFISMEKSYKGRGDGSLLKLIKSRLPEELDIELVNVDMGAKKVLDIFGGLDFLCATKTHSVVYGLRKAVPTLAVAYDPKTLEFMKEFHVERYSIPLKDFDSEEAYKRFSELVMNKNRVKRELASALPRVQMEALANIHAINATLERQTSTP
ncbi:MAG: polysaccharide pyruvyl transferase family protein [Thermodesulfobacteriota bacterium]|nr:polysaccharide pyruvyl transferase family protein [Thermodesulfobacteriota bacterium]